jgi:uncharacterized protein YjbJ (UPF0337 family)
MNKDILMGRWKEIKGEVKMQWGRLTDDDLTEVAGMEDMLLGMLQKHYGYARDEAERHYLDFMRGLTKRDLDEEKALEREKEELPPR